MSILTAQDLYVAPHLADEFESLRAGLLAQYQPIGATQIQTLSALLRASWDLRRCDEAELTLARQLGHDPLLAQPDARTRHLHRVRTQAGRDYRMALQELRRQQTDHAIRSLPENAPTLTLPAGIDTKAYLQAARAARGLRKDDRLPLITMQQALIEKLQETPTPENAAHHQQEIAVLVKAITRQLQLTLGARRRQPPSTQSPAPGADANATGPTAVPFPKERVA